jgi:hypothetical protein
VPVRQIRTKRSNADVDYKCNLLIAPSHPAAYSVTGVLSSL